MVFVPVKPVQLNPLSATGSLLNVIFAVALRESLLRFGRFKLGLLWAVLEPVLYVAVHMVVLTNASALLAGVPNLPAYAFAGVVPYLLFRSMVEKGASTLDAGRILMLYRQVTPFALLAARPGLEAITMTVVVLLTLIGFALTTGLPWPRPDVAAMAYLALVVLSFGLASCAAVVATFYPAARQFIGFFNRVLYLISGVLFPLSAVAPAWSSYLTWNPLLHAIELIRAGILGVRSPDAVSLQFLWLCALGALLLGLTLTRVFRRELEPS